ncbi:MAG: hypothetical protein IPJ41_06160 [Phycisphaerales bacterium]|nr:hypothetical protein [Phycisphaerales bacterium]
MQAGDKNKGGCCGGCGGGNVLSAAAGLLDQCGVLLDSIDDATYALVSGVIRGGTIGKHLRHTLDHFAAIVGRLGAEPIDYDHRERGVAVETDRAAARGQISSLQAALAGLEGTGGQDVLIRVMLSDDGREALLRSTVAREVAFATHHGIHHVAMMKAIAAEMGIELPTEIGRAPSTLHFERSGAGAS